jgi:hypothetical protein
VRGRRRKCSLAIGTVMTSSARWTLRAMRDELATWSTRINLPPGRKHARHLVERRVDVGKVVLVP